MIIGLVGAGASFYNAFSREGLPLYEVDMHRQKKNTGRPYDKGEFCPNCGKPTGSSDRFCKHCGNKLED